MYHFCLYVAGTSDSAQLAIRNVTEICDKYFSDQYQLKIVDVVENPQLAEADNILVTPTLICETSSRQYRIIGNLTRHKNVLDVLGVAC